MEKDINLILDVEPHEAQALIDLIELLFEEWYVASHVREERLKKLGVVVENKSAKRAQAKLPPTPEKLPAPEPDRVMCGKGGKLECDHITPMQREPGHPPNTAYRITSSGLILLRR